MNPIRELILNEIVKPEIRSSIKTYIGTIESIDTSTRTATVSIGEASEGLFENVPYDRGITYVHGEEPKAGSPVIVSFLGGDMSYPYIVAILNNDIIINTTGKTFMMPDATMVSTPSVSVRSANRVIRTTV